LEFREPLKLFGKFETHNVEILINKIDEFSFDEVGAIQESTVLGKILTVANLITRKALNS
jgi:hypothetical protein